MPTEEVCVKMSHQPAIVSHWLPRGPARGERIKVKCGTHSLMIPLDDTIQDDKIAETHANAVTLFCRQMGWEYSEIIQASLADTVFVFIRMDG